MLLRQFKQLGLETKFELKEGDIPRVDTIKHAQIPLHIKAGLLEFIWKHAGPLAILSVGMSIKEVEYDPIWRSAIRSESPEVFLKKWQRFEVFAHSKNRVKINRITGNKYAFRRYTVDGDTPSAAENLLICGLLIALLERIGCQGLRCQLITKNGSIKYIRENRRFLKATNIHDLNTAEWIITWDDFSSQIDYEDYEFEGHVRKLILPYVQHECKALETAIRLLMQDVTRSWKIDALARELGLSKRSFQRKLNETNLSFSHLIRMIRIDEACRLLKESDATITVIGFCAGFSDSAHFSRDFRSSMGMTPTDYRGLWN